MNEKAILTKLSENKISLKRSYKLLYKKRKIRKAKFVKMRIDILESKKISFFINMLFLLPIPVGILMFFLKNYKSPIHKDFPLTVYELLELGIYKGAHIMVSSPGEANIKIKAI